MTGGEIAIALTDIGASGGGDYILKGGDYEVSNIIRIPSFTRLVCQGNVRFIPTKNIDTLFFMKDAKWSGLLGGEAVPNGQYKIGNAAFIYGDSHDCMIERFFADSAGFGILVQATPAGVRPFNNFISRNAAMNCGTGCYIDGADRTRIEDNDFYQSLTVGLLIGNSNVGTLRGNACDHNGSHGTYLSGCKDLSLIGERNCNNGGSGLHIRFYGDPVNPVKDENNVVLGGVFNYNGGNGVHLQMWANHNVIDGSVCRGNSGVGLRMHEEGCTGNKVSVIAYENQDGQITDECVGNVVTHNVEK